MHVRKPYLLLGSVALWILLGRILQGKNTLQIDTYENTSLQPLSAGKLWIYVEIEQKVQPLSISLTQFVAR